MSRGECFGQNTLLIYCIYFEILGLSTAIQMVLLFQIILNEPYGFEVDWWSFGVIMYRLLYPGLPFCHECEIQYKEDIEKGVYSTRAEKSRIRKDFITRVCNKNNLLYSIFSLNSFV